MTIGEKRVPATEDLKGNAMFYLKLMGVMGGEPFAISRAKFETTSFIASFDLEAAPMVQHSGLSTMNAPLNIFLEDLFLADDPRPPSGVYVHSNSDALLEISRRGCILSV